MKTRLEQSQRLLQSGSYFQGAAFDAWSKAAKVSKTAPVWKLFPGSCLDTPARMLISKKV
jgi:hypothetical protein